MTTRAGGTLEVRLSPQVGGGGTLAGRGGSFVLRDGGTMERGAQRLSVMVVPDPGAGELTGLAGRMNIVVADGRHSYEFDYALGGD